MWYNNRGEMRESKNAERSGIMKTSEMRTKDYIFVALKGVLLGLISLGIPGVSASTVGIIIGIYFTMVDSIANIFKDFRHNALFLLALMIGYGAGAVGAAFSVTVLAEKAPLVITLAIMGVIVASVVNMLTDLKKEVHRVSNWVVFVVVLVVIFVYNMTLAEGTETSFPASPDLFDLIVMAIIGLFTSATFIIPGVDFAIVFMSLGIYYPFMNMLANIFSFGAEGYLSLLIVNLEILGFYLAGYFVGVFLFSKLIRFLITKFGSQTQFASLAFVVAAPAVFLKKSVFENEYFYTSVPQFIVGGILAALFMGLMLGFNRYRKSKAFRQKAELAEIETASVPVAPSAFPEREEEESGKEGLFSSGQTEEPMAEDETDSRLGKEEK